MLKVKEAKQLDNNRQKPDGKPGNASSQWSPYDRHLPLQGNECVLLLTTPPDERLYDTSEQFGSQHSMYRYNFDSHDQQEQVHHQSSAKSIFTVT